jgi:hypothetical protein
VKRAQVGQSDRRQPVRIALTALRDLDNLLGQDFLYDRRLTFGVSNIGKAAIPDPGVFDPQAATVNSSSSSSTSSGQPSPQASNKTTAWKILSKNLKSFIGFDGRRQRGSVLLASNSPSVYARR